MDQEPCGVFVKIKTPEGAALLFSFSFLLFKKEKGETVKIKSSRLVLYVRQRIIFPNFILLKKRK
jgi:hypothetical protein